MHSAADFGPEPDAPTGAGNADDAPEPDADEAGLPEETGRSEQKITTKFLTKYERGTLFHFCNTVYVEPPPFNKIYISKGVTTKTSN